MQAHSQMVLFPEPRGMAIANRPPRSTACSIFAMTLRWSGDHGRENVSGKYCSQKKRKSEAETRDHLHALFMFAHERGGLLTVPQDWQTRWGG